MLFRTPALTALAALWILVAGATGSAAQDAAADSAEMAAFKSWRDSFRARALKAGIPHDVFEKALGGIRPDPKVHEKNADQPEFTRAVWDYLDGALSETRIDNGRRMLGRHASALGAAEQAYGVPRRFLVAIWGMETSYGKLLGNHNIFEALATLSYRGDRRDYAEEQLLAALRLLADGHKPLEAMKGSWAGAVGHTQFVPTTYLKYAVDGDRDGRRDLWDSLSDVFHSTANYLKESGFDRNLKWGREAVLPEGFDYALAGDHMTKPLGEWRALGVKMTDGKLVPDMDIPASILLPAGHQGPAFLIYANFEALLTYNRSISYALAIGLLSDRIQGYAPLQKPWPRHLKPLSRDERMEIQRRLIARGYLKGKEDGVLGRDSRDAIRAFQKDHDLVADGYATTDLVAQLRAAEPAGPAKTEGSASLPAAPAQTDADTVSVVAVPAPAADETVPAEGAAKPESGAEAAAPLAAGHAGNAALRLAVGVGSATGDAVKAPEAESALDADSPYARHEAIHRAGAADTGESVSAAGEQTAARTNGASAAARPVNNGEEPIIAPPDTAYVGAAGETDAPDEGPASEETGEDGKTDENADEGEDAPGAGY